MNLFYHSLKREVDLAEAVKKISQVNTLLKFYRRAAKNPGSKLAQQRVEELERQLSEARAEVAKIRNTRFRTAEYSETEIWR